MKKQIVSETKQYQPSFPDELLLDDTPKVNSFNGVTSDGVARAIAGASGEVPVVTESDNGKVLKASYDEGGPAVEWGEATVDQTYDSTSTNAQSGTAVAQAISSASYTAGDGIDIANGGISVKAGTGLEIDDVTNTETISLKATSDSTTRNVYEICPLTSDILQKMSAQTGLTITTSVQFSLTYGIERFVGLASWGASGAGSIDKMLVLSTIGSGNILPTNTSLVYNTNQVHPASTTTLAYVQEHISEFHVVIFDYFSGWRVGYFTADEGSVQVETATYSVTDTIQDALCVSNPLPTSAVGDAGKVLTVDNAGAAAWKSEPAIFDLVAGTGISITEGTDDVTIAADVLPAYDTTADAGKVLQVTANGLAWVALS